MTWFYQEGEKNGKRNTKKNSTTTRINTHTIKSMPLTRMDEKSTKPEKKHMPLERMDEKLTKRKIKNKTKQKQKKKTKTKTKQKQSLNIGTQFSPSRTWETGWRAPGPASHLSHLGDGLSKKGASSNWSKTEGSSRRSIILRVGKL